MSKKEIKDEAVIVTMKGEVDIYSIDRFRKSIEESFDQNAAEIILECTELSYIDSIGMGVLIEMRNRSQEIGKKIIIANPKSNIKKLLALTGVDRIIDIIESSSSGAKKE